MRIHGYAVIDEEHTNKCDFYFTGFGTVNHSENFVERRKSTMGY